MKETFENLNGTANLIFQNIQDIHLADPYVWEPYPQGSKTNVKVLQFVMIFLLVFACINYVNMATANSSERAPEVGIRKTLGSSKKSLIAQFLTESVLLATFSALSALLFALLFLNAFNNLTDVQLTWKNLTATADLGVLFSVSFIIGLLAGIYPALYLSSIAILKTLKGKFATGKDGDFLRKVLVTVQYSIAATLITGIFLVFNQIHHIKTKDIGYDKENILVIDIPRDSVVMARSTSFSEELKSRSDVLGTAFSGYTLDEEANQFTPTLRNLDGGTFKKGADLIAVDHDFINTIGITLVHGRNFRNSSKADEEQSIIVNEAAVKSFGWTADPLKGGMRAGTDDEGNPQFMNVIGVVKDFNLGVSYAEVNPLIIFYDTRGGGSIYAKLSSNDLFTSLKEIETQWNRFFPAHEMGYHFVDQDLERLYRREEKFLGLLSFFSITIAIIASLGLIGLISYLTRVKRKEIAIRKVLGSPIQDVIMLLSKRFLWLLIIANLLSVPITYYLINVWLSNFASRAELSIWPFVLSFLIAMVLTAFALAYHIRKAAYENPIHSIKYE
ncbi:MAG: FtsX-like permease family protein, partial [Bacteroidota bacterium]